MRLDPLSALRHLEALDDQQLCALADRVDKVRRVRKGTARRVREVGECRVLWHCTPPYENWDGEQHEYVVTSFAVPSGPECYAFPANEAGEITDWGELDISQKGDVSHSRLWRDAGWWVE